MVDLMQAIKDSAAERRRNEARRLAEVKKQRRIKRIEAEIVQTLDQARESWRRYEALPTAQPTPERAAKALEISPIVINGKAVRKVATTADLLQNGKTPHLPRHLRRALDIFAAAVAESMGVQVEDGGTGSAKLIACYDGTPGGAYGPREIPDRVLRARYLWKSVERQMPMELMAVAEQLVGEETGLLQGRPASLSRHGEVVGYSDNRQAVAAGTALAYAACAVLNHALKIGIGRPQNSVVDL
jgi:flagellin-specific chaperone FliS